MGVDAILELARAFGPIGLIVGYLIWRETRAEKIAERRIEADKALAAALALLEATIKGRV